MIESSIKMTRNINCPNGKIPVGFVVGITLIFCELKTKSFTWRHHRRLFLCRTQSWALSILHFNNFWLACEMAELQFTLRPALCTQWYFTTSENTRLLEKWRASFSDGQIPPYLLVITTIPFGWFKKLCTYLPYLKKKKKRLLCKSLFENRSCRKIPHNLICSHSYS